jgi:8-oxo-dGTP diphosphatase
MVELKNANGFYRLSIKALVLDKDKRFLMCKEKDGLWELPGGGLDYGESVNECLKREIFEEMKLKVTKVDTSPSYFETTEYMKFPGTWKGVLVYEVRLKNLKFKPSEECVEIRFFNKKEAQKIPLGPTMKSFVKAYNPKNH